MNLSDESGLLFTSIEISFRGKTKTIDRVVVDTGAVHSIIVVDEVSDIGIFFEPGDTLVNRIGIGGEEYCFSKAIDMVSLRNKDFLNVDIDFGNLDGFNINGLIGLDLLKTGEFLIDLKNLKLTTDF
ncbi:aspartyl protease family protein [Sporosarcina limicola]|uniref:Aspartyl protease n=1 Tax=Sporosarcina limicola TaxID=34101 RepID=A0A927R204_9BACL|nr:aspartyl protease family protein [Sporosarcina limicola]MBE1553366.1 putative aspartyl protease [Sporosarcina limicola]